MDLEFRWVPKLLLWIMLMFSCLGAVSTLFRTETDPVPALLTRTAEQQMAIQTALGFAREWMFWDGGELPEERVQRLQPYVNPDALARVAALQAESNTRSQQVMASECLTIAASGGSSYRVRVRVIVANPERMMWEVEVPVWVQATKGAAVTDPPIIRSLQEPPIVPKIPQAAAASAAVKERMRSAMESFLKAICESKDAGSLLNYVTADAKMVPLNGRLRFVTLDRLEATGEGPYDVTVSFTIEDASTGFRLAQVWRMKVTEENQKFFVAAMQ